VSERMGEIALVVGLLIIAGLMLMLKAVGWMVNAR
jgi:hypothetical protein